MEPTGPSLSNSKQAQNVVTKYAGFNDFMMKHLIKKGDPATNNRPITNTRIGDKDSQIYGGSYSIPETEYQTFLQLYAKDILSTNKKEYLSSVANFINSKKYIIRKGSYKRNQKNHPYEITANKFAKKHTNNCKKWIEQTK